VTSSSLAPACEEQLREARDIALADLEEEDVLGPMPSMASLSAPRPLGQGDPISTVAARGTAISF